MTESRKACASLVSFVDDSSRTECVKQRVKALRALVNLRLSSLNSGSLLLLETPTFEPLHTQLRLTESVQHVRRPRERLADSLHLDCDPTKRSSGKTMYCTRRVPASEALPAEPRSKLVARCVRDSMRGVQSRRAVPDAGE